LNDTPWVCGFVSPMDARQRRILTYLESQCKTYSELDESTLFGKLKRWITGNPLCHLFIQEGRERIEHHYAQIQLNSNQHFQRYGGRYPPTCRYNMSNPDHETQAYNVFLES
jgi:hypothetical protein